MDGRGCTVESNTNIGTCKDFFAKNKMVIRAQAKHFDLNEWHIKVKELKNKCNCLCHSTVYLELAFLGDKLNRRLNKLSVPSLTKEVYGHLKEGKMQGGAGCS